MRFQLLASVNMKVTVFWDVTTSSLIGMQYVVTFWNNWLPPSSEYNLFCPFKFWYSATNLHGTTSQKSMIFSHDVFCVGVEHLDHSLFLSNGLWIGVHIQPVTATSLWHRQMVGAQVFKVTAFFMSCTIAWAVLKLKIRLLLPSK